MSTDRLIDDLARDLRPAPVLRAPWARAARWLLVAVVYLGALALLTASAADVEANRAHGWPFLVAQGAAIAMSAASALAAFVLTVPGRSPRVLIIPVVMATVWVGTLVAGAVNEGPAPETVNLARAHEWLCVALIVFAGMPLWLALVLMVRQGAPLAPRATAALGALAVAAATNVAACVSYPHPTLVTLIWHGGTMLALMAGAAASGRWLTVSWPDHHQLARRT